MAPKLIDDRPEKSEAIDVMELAQFAEDDFCSMVPDPLRLVSPHRIRLNDFDAAVTMQSFQFETDYGLKVRAVRQLTVFSHREILYAIMMCNASKTKLLDEQMCFHSSVRSLVGYLTSNMRWDRLNPSVKLTHKRLVGSIEGESVVEVARRVSKKPIPVQSVFHHDRRVYHDDSNVYLGCAST